MDELFAALMELTRNASVRADDLTIEQWNDFMEARTQLLVQIRRLDAQLPDDAIERRSFSNEVRQLAEWDRLIVGRFEVLKADAAEQLGKISDFKKQKDAYDGTDQNADSFFFDTKW